MPRENPAVGDDRPWKAVLHEPMHEVDGMAHPLIGDAARELAIQPKLTINLGIKRPIRFGQKPFAPVGILFPNEFRHIAPSLSRAMVVPDNLDLTYFPEYATLYQIVSLF